MSAQYLKALCIKTPEKVIIQILSKFKAHYFAKNQMDQNQFHTSYEGNIGRLKYQKSAQYLKALIKNIPKTVIIQKGPRPITLLKVIGPEGVSHFI